MKRVTAYQTTLGIANNTKPITLAIEKALITTDLKNASLSIRGNTEGYSSIFVTGAFPQETEIPLFTHPIAISNSKGQKYICSDLRMYLRQNPDINNILPSVKNLTEYNFVKAKTALNMLWLNQQTQDIKIGLSFAGVVYAAWLSESIAKSFSLDYADQTKINIIAMVFYNSLFQDEEDKAKDYDHRALVTHIINSTRLPADMVYYVVEQIGTLDTINDFCTEVQRIVGNVRLEKFNVPLLLTIIGNSWYGTSAKENITVALEFPPIWAAIVYTALTERMYKTSRIYTIAERYGKRGGSRVFEEAFVMLMKENSIEPNQQLHIRDF